jgi:hypothetical protein
MRAPAAFAFGALLLFACAAGARAQQAAATTCCLELLAPVGARAVALGDAIAARTGAGSLFANPATVAAVRDDQFVVHTAATPVSRSNTFSLLVHSEIVGTIGLSYHMSNLGEIEATDNQGNVTGELRLLDHALTATYATGIAPGLNAGLSYQLFQSRQDCNGLCSTESLAATTHLVDAGLTYRPAFADSIEVGVSLLHFGFPLQARNAEQAAPTPTRLRAGAAVEVLRFVRLSTPVMLWLSGDVNIPLQTVDETSLHVGAEATFENRFFVWLGYAGASGRIGGAGIGVGLEIDRFTVGVAKPLSSTPVDGTETFQASFAVRF